MATKFATKKSIPAVDTTRIDERVATEYAEAVAQQAAVLSEAMLPQGKRLVLATLGWLVTYASAFYWGVQLVDIALIALATVSASAFLAYLVAFIGIVAAFFAAWLAAGKAFKFIVEFDVERMANIGRAIKDASVKRTSLVAGWFKRDEPVIAEAR